MRLASRAVLALTLAFVAAVGLAPSVDGGESRVRHHGSGADAAVVARVDGLQAATVRFDREHRRESFASQRSFKHLLAAAVLLAALGATSGLGSRRAVTSAGFRPPLTSRWFRDGGRAPPSFQLSVI